MLGQNDRFTLNVQNLFYGHYRFSLINQNSNFSDGIFFKENIHEKNMEGNILNKVNYFRPEKISAAKFDIGLSIWIPHNEHLIGSVARCSVKKDSNITLELEAFVVQSSLVIHDQENFHFIMTQWGRNSKKSRNST